MQNSQRNWQVQAHGQVHKVKLEELEQWIIDGSVSPADNVRHDDLPWTAAEKVPVLGESFNLPNAARNGSPAAVDIDLPTSGEQFCSLPLDDPTASSAPLRDSTAAANVADQSDEARRAENFDARKLIGQSVREYKNLIRRSLKNKLYSR